MTEVGSFEGAILIGKEGYLFLGGEDGNRAALITGKRRIEPRYFEIFGRNIARRSAWATAQGCAYLHMVVPDKPSILPSAWPLEPPLPVGQRYLDQCPELSHALLYPLDVLAGDSRMLSRLDTHLSTLGSARLASVLAEHFEQQSQYALFAQIAALMDYPRSVQGDLGSQMDPARSETIYGLRLAPPGQFLSNQREGKQDGGIDIRLNPYAPYAKRVVMFGDAFGRDIALCLQFFYCEVVFFRSVAFHPELAQSCNPDILVTEQVERYLDHCHEDTDAPAFFDLPSLTSESYDPSISFLEAFKKITASGGAEQRRNANAESMLRTLHGVVLSDPPEQTGILQVLEVPRTVNRNMPALVADFSGVGLELNLPKQQHLHGSYLVRRRGALLFGPNHLVTPEGWWSCEARNYKQQYLDYFQQPFYDRIFPGAKPKLERNSNECRLDLSSLTAPEIIAIDEPVFLATPLEPSIWGRWIATVIHKAQQYRQFCSGQKFLCHQTHVWQQEFLKLLGIPSDRILPHNPGRVYKCNDVTTVELSDANMTVSALERINYFTLAAQHRHAGAGLRKLFVSRLSRSRQQPHYRALQNEVELSAALETLGFFAVEPEMLPIVQQIALFAAAEQIVFLGGSGVFNAAFCAPGTGVVTIESSNQYVVQHTEFLASLGLRYGVIFGRSDPEDSAPSHRRWTIDIARTREAVSNFFGSS